MKWKSIERELAIQVNMSWKIHMKKHECKHRQYQEFQIAARL